MEQQKIINPEAQFNIDKSWDEFGLKEGEQITILQSYVIRGTEFIEVESSENEIIDIPRYEFMLGWKNNIITPI